MLTVQIFIHGVYNSVDGVCRPSNSVPQDKHYCPSIAKTLIKIAEILISEIDSFLMFPRPAISAFSLGKPRRQAGKIGDVACDQSIDLLPVTR